MAVLRGACPHAPDDGHVADFLDDDESVAARPCCLGGRASSVVGSFEERHRWGRDSEQGMASAVGGFHAQSDCEARLASSSGTQEDHVRGFGDECTRGEVSDRVALHPR